MEGSRIPGPGSNRYRTTRRWRSSRHWLLNLHRHPPTHRARVWPDRRGGCRSQGRRWSCRSTPRWKGAEERRTGLDLEESFSCKGYQPERDIMWELKQTNCLLTPVFIKGMVKSTADWRMEVTDMSMTAMSAFWDLSSAIIPVHLKNKVNFLPRISRR